MKSLDVTASWRSRIETPRASAVRMARMLTGLAAIHPCFNEWYRQGRSRKTAFRQAWLMPPDIEDLSRFFEKARHRDLDGRVTDTEFSCWNGREHDTPMILVFFGNTAAENLLLPNRCEIRMSASPEDGPALSVADIKRVLIVLAEAWDIDFGNLWPDRFIPPIWESVSRPLLSSTWISYFSAELAARFSAPPGVTIERRPGGACIVQTTDQYFDKNNPHHLAMADAMNQAILVSFGPLPAWGKMHEARARLGWG